MSAVFSAARRVPAPAGPVRRLHHSRCQRHSDPVCTSAALQRWRSNQAASTLSAFVQRRQVTGAAVLVRRHRRLECASRSTSRQPRPTASSMRTRWLRAAATAAETACRAQVLSSCASAPSSRRGSDVLPRRGQRPCRRPRRSSARRGPRARVASRSPISAPMPLSRVVSSRTWRPRSTP
mgnify:CR=1 FL=1